MEGEGEGRGDNQKYYMGEATRELENVKGGVGSVTTKHVQWNPP